jgi:serine/threonine-protein kinase
LSVQSAGRVLGGRYRLIREIARGGMGTVWEAEDTLLDRPVAVKLLHAQFAEDPEFLERFRREARAAARLSHPNIVSIFDVGEDAETRTPFIVMELVNGGNLKERIQRSAPLPDYEIRELGAALAAALEYAHRRGIVHRDVKPQNVLLDEDGRPRLTDFGIAQAMASKGLTRTGAVMGSVHYLAPELARGRPALPQSDLYSLGVVLYEMATGRAPFEAETDLAVALAHAEQLPAAPRALNAHLAPDLERIIMRSLAKSPEDRFASGGELASELRAAAPPPVAARARTRAEAVTQRMPTVPAAAAAAVGQRPAPKRTAAAAPAAQAGAFSRRTARPVAKRGAGGGVLALLLAAAAVLVALGAGFFGLATLGREGVATPVPTAAPTAVSKPVAVPSSTPVPATSTATPEATATASPTVSPTPSPAPPSPTPPPPPSPTPRLIAVPQLRAKTLDDARITLQNAGLAMTVKGVPANVDKNVVVDQSPDVGATVPPGTTISINVGSGSTVIPEVTNLSRDQAIKTLQSNSFKVTTRDRRDPRIPQGNAIGTTPPAGTALPRNSDIELSISAGR